MDTQDFKIKTKQEDLKKSEVEFSKDYNKLKVKSKMLENLTTKYI
ncbi:hypothetical protein [Clostridium estertheticum]|nr:hypothetical protein [Clostridium estertheticum]